MTVRVSLPTIIRAAEGDSRRIIATINTASVGRDQLVLVSAGVDLAAFRRNPVILWQHNPDWPIARAGDVAMNGSDLVATIDFPPAGASERADEVYALIRAGIINATSTGFNPIESEPGVDGATKITRSELQEISLVSIPALPDALITERSRKMRRTTRKPSTPAQRAAIAARFTRELASTTARSTPAERSVIAARFRRDLARPATSPKATRRFTSEQHRDHAKRLERELESAAMRKGEEFRQAAMRAGLDPWWAAKNLA